MQQLIPGDDLAADPRVGCWESDAGQMVILLDPLNVGKEDF